MSADGFVDTNILVYAVETSGPGLAKAESARELIRTTALSLSTQVLGEFYSAVTSARRESPLSHVEAVAWIQFWKKFDVHPVTCSTVDLALELAASAHINYYDGLILAAARLAGCSIVYSEDLNTGQDFSGVVVKNPLAP